jgi:hypothetical protein
MLAIVITCGVLAINAIVFVLVFGAVRRNVARARAALEAQGIERDSGLCRATFRYRRYRAPGRYYGAGIRITRAQLVLTREVLAVLGQRIPPIPRGELARYAVGVQESGRLQLVTDQPIGASGHLDMTFVVEDPAAWVRALRDAGARASS